MPNDKNKSKAAEIATGFEAFRKVAADAAEKTKNQPKQPKPPEVDTGSFGGLVKSLKDRASYAIWGPPEKKDK